MSKSNTKPFLSAKTLIRLLKASPRGVVHRQAVHRYWGDASRAIHEARAKRKIGVHQAWLFDPERMDKDAALLLAEQYPDEDGLPDFPALVAQTVTHSPKPALAAQEIEQAIGDFFHMSFIKRDSLEALGLGLIEIRAFPPYQFWYYALTNDPAHVQTYVQTEAEKRHAQAWEAVMRWAGDTLRLGADGHMGEGDFRAQALARLYSRGQLEAVLGLPDRVLRHAFKRSLLPANVCPDGVKRYRAAEVHRLRDDDGLRQSLENDQTITIWQLRNFTDLKIGLLRQLLQKHKVQPLPSDSPDGERTWYRWGDVHPVLYPEGKPPSLSDLDMVESLGGTGRQALWSDFLLNLHQENDEKRRQSREQRDRKRSERNEKREALRAQMINNFPNWFREDDVEQVATLYVGPTNSGKTHNALLELAKANSGWYLAPLRLLAREMFERLNRMGCYCNLLTGEERIDVPFAKVTAATVEMFNPAESGECVVVDEAHMVGDDNRGWAWTRALVNARAPNLHIITAPHGLNLLTKFFENIGVEAQVLRHERLVPLEMAPRHWELESLPPRTILIAFTRRDVLKYKFMLQEAGRSVAVVYGSLPPEVRLRQAQRFERGEAEICVATDAVGMGLNLPADNVAFTTLMKFDGFEHRRLYASELQQIAGRAGRFGYSKHGYVGAIDRNLMEPVRKLLMQAVPDVQVARLAPRTDEVELLEGDLAQRLMTWRQLNAIPESLRSIVTSTELTDRIELARFLSYADLMQLGVERALTLVNAPVRQESQEYWVECAAAVLRDDPLPLPPPPPSNINEGNLLKHAEGVIACMDIYLWLGYRDAFRHLAHHLEAIIEARENLTREIDLALMRRFNPMARRIAPGGRGRGHKNAVYDDL